MAESPLNASSDNEYSGTDRSTPVPLRGVRAQDSEAVTAYLSRVAAQHDVSLMQHDDLDADGHIVVTVLSNDSDKRAAALADLLDETVTA